MNHVCCGCGGLCDSGHPCPMAYNCRCRSRRSAADVEALKSSWTKDPSWDIEDTEGFEAHREELIVWRRAHEEEAAAERASARKEALDVLMAPAVAYLQRLDNEIVVGKREALTFDIGAA